MRWEQWSGRPAHGIQDSFADGKLECLIFDPADHRDFMTACGLLELFQFKSNAAMLRAACSPLRAYRGCTVQEL